MPGLRPADGSARRVDTGLFARLPAARAAGQAPAITPSGLCGLWRCFRSAPLGQAILLVDLQGTQPSAPKSRVRRATDGRWRPFAVSGLRQRGEGSRASWARPGADARRQDHRYRVARRLIRPAPGVCQRREPIRPGLVREPADRPFSAYHCGGAESRLWLLPHGAFELFIH
jgi:hypothetical protein